MDDVPIKNLTHSCLILNAKLESKSPLVHLTIGVSFTTRQGYMTFQKEKNCIFLHQFCIGVWVNQP